MASNRNWTKCEFPLSLQETQFKNLRIGTVSWSWSFLAPAVMTMYPDPWKIPMGSPILSAPPSFPVQSLGGCTSTLQIKGGDKSPLLFMARGDNGNCSALSNLTGRVMWGAVVKHLLSAKLGTHSSWFVYSCHNWGSDWSGVGGVVDRGGTVWQRGEWKQVGVNKCNETDLVKQTVGCFWFVVEQNKINFMFVLY